MDQSTRFARFTIRVGFPGREFADFVRKQKFLAFYRIMTHLVMHIYYRERSQQEVQQIAQATQLVTFLA